MSITRINHFSAAQNKGAELQAFLRGVVLVVQQQPGCEGCRLLVDAQNADRFVVVEDWASVAHHQAAARAIPPEEIAKVMPLLSAPPSGGYFDPIAADA
jgi:quinol monooxygenase YgiN